MSNTTQESEATNYGRRCAEAVNAKDWSLHNHLKQQFNHLKASASLKAGSGLPADEMQSEFNKAYRENRNLNS